MHTISMDHTGISLAQYASDLQDRVGTTYHNVWSTDMFGPHFPGPWHAFNTEFNIDAIRKFVDAIGDLNPVFRDADYAASTPHGQRLAPPTILYSVAYGHYPNPAGYAPIARFGGVYAGDEYEWYDTIREGDKIDLTTITPTKVELKKTRSAGDVVFYHGQHVFRRRQTGEVIGRCTFTAGLREGEIGAHRPPQAAPVTHTEEYIREVYAAQDAEHVRGSTPRYWEDVLVGEELPPVVRGPFTQMEAVAWIVGGMGERFFISDRLHRLMHAHNGRGLWDPKLSIHKNFHDETVTERALGAGAQRSSWVGMMLTNWMGDHGFLRKLTSRHTQSGRYGNVYWAKGLVTGKRVEDGMHCVDIACEVINSFGQNHFTGSATVVLPTRDAPARLAPAPSH